MIGVRLPSSAPFYKASGHNGSGLFLVFMRVFELLQLHASFSTAWLRSLRKENYGHKSGHAIRRGHFLE